MSGGGSAGALAPPGYPHPLHTTPSNRSNLARIVQDTSYFALIA
jgi:hypothetical protein